MVVIECNVCHIPDLLNHHGCDRVSVTDMTAIRGGKLIFILKTGICWGIQIQICEESAKKDYRTLLGLPETDIHEVKATWD